MRAVGWMTTLLVGCIACGSGSSDSGEKGLAISNGGAPGAPGGGSTQTPIPNGGAPGAPGGPPATSRPTVVSVTPAGLPAAYSGAASLPYRSGSPLDLGSGGPDISADGRYVVFHSGALDLVPGTEGGRTHIFRRDLLTQKTELVSVDASPERVQNGGYAYDPNVSADGRYVCFTYVHPTWWSRPTTPGVPTSSWRTCQKGRSSK
jgi:hypothetical protein